MRFAFLSLGFFFLIACNKMDPNPHLMDPIYADLNSEMAKSKKEVDDAQKAFDTAAGDVQNIEPQTGQYKLKWKAYFEAEKKLQLAKQKAFFYELRLDSRERDDKKEYRKAFIEGKPWPDPNEYSAYKKNRQLASAPRTWDVRVPKLRGPPTPEDKKATEKKGEGGGGAEHSAPPAEH